MARSRSSGAPMDGEAFLRAAEQDDVAPVVVLHGPHPVLAEETVARLVGILCGAGADVVLARETLDVRESGIEPAVRAARTMPFLVRRRVVVARGSETLAERSGTSLLEYLRAPNPAAVLILLAGRELEPAHWLIKALPAGNVVSLAPPAGRALVGWLRGRARTRGIELEEPAARMLVDLAGDDAGALLAELEKAALAGGPDGRRVGVDEVESVVGTRRARSVFELLRAIEARDRGPALGVLQALLDGGEEPLGVVAMLAREARAAWQVKEWRRRGRSPEDIARSLRRPPAAAAALVARAERMTPAEVPAGLVRCWNAERRLKLGASPRAELALLVADLCGP